jgi:hypothetical protein
MYYDSSGKESTDPNHLPYNYVPTEWVCIMFVGLFALFTSKPVPEGTLFFLSTQQGSLTTMFMTVVHVVQAIHFRLWWLFPTAVLCGLLETIGWSGRLWSSRNPHLHKAFIMQCVFHDHGPMVILRTVTLTTEVRQDFDDDRGTYTLYRSQLYHLGTDHKTAWPTFLSTKSQEM